MRRLAALVVAIVMSGGVVRSESEPPGDKPGAALLEVLEAEQAGDAGRAFDRLAEPVRLEIRKLKALASVSGPEQRGLVETLAMTPAQIEALLLRDFVVRLMAVRGFKPVVIDTPATPPAVEFLKVVLRGENRCRIRFRIGDGPTRSAEFVREETTWRLIEPAFLTGRAERRSTSRPPRGFEADGPPSSSGRPVLSERSSFRPRRDEEVTLIRSATRNDAGMDDEIRSGPRDPVRKAGQATGGPLEWFVPGSEDRRHTLECLNNLRQIGGLLAVMKASGQLKYYNAGPPATLSRRARPRCLIPAGRQILPASAAARPPLLAACGGGAPAALAPAKSASGTKISKVSSTTVRPSSCRSLIRSPTTT